MSDSGVPCLSSTLIEFILAIFLIIHSIFDLDRIFHTCLRFCKKEAIYPKFHAVLPLSTKVQNYPLVAIQLPMMNEIECCEAVIACACSLIWPKSRLIIEVLDDSTDEDAKMLIDRCVKRWSKRGIRIQVYRRQDRQGFKAGNLIAGMKFIRDVEYIAIFDADFLPTNDYLHKTIPILMKDPTVAFVQARWTFINAKESFLTRMQEITLNFHHKCEQEGRFRSSLFFTFNGTGGVWRREAIEQIGGWHSDTLVEDLDLSLRAYIHGWRSVYRCNLGCLNELPPTQGGYLSQQYRWTSGPMQVARKISPFIIRSNRICWYKKLYCLWYLFRSWIHLITFLSLVVIMPLSVWRSKTDTYNIISISCTIITCMCHFLFTHEEMHLIVPYVLFMNAMSLNNACATIAGLFNYGQAKEWIVTPKFGITSSDRFFYLIEQQKKTRRHYTYYLLLPILVVTNYGQSFYRNMKDRYVKIVRFHGRFMLVAIYLLYVAHMAYQKEKYWSSLYLAATSVMYMIIALNSIGRPQE